MLLAIKKFFDEKLSVSSEQSSDQDNRKIELASAALMFELIKTDSKIDAREKQALAQVLRDTFALDDETVSSLVTMAQEATDEATSLYEFTTLVNEHYGYDQRVKLIENLWRVAFADTKLDRYEEHLIRRVSDLIYVRHSDFIRTKLLVKEKLEADHAQ